MGDYGTYLTRYEGLSNDALYSMYRESVYKNLNEDEKLDLLQETVNRDALEYGEIGTPRVEFAELAVNVSGEAANGVIKVDYDMAVNGRQSIVYHDRTVAHCVDDYNIQALNTVLHENAHCFQEQVADGTIEISDSQLAAQYQGNGFTTSAVLQDGSYRLGSQYLEGVTPGGYYMYYFQATERDAFRMAEVKTNNILQKLESQHGTEPSFQAYAKGVEANGYQAMEQRAIQLFHNPNFEHDVNQVLQNQYFGTNIPVHENTEHAVKNEMTATYESWLQETAQHDHLDLKGEENMGFNPKPVSLEEYNQTLRDTVNAYYTHTMNDPTMSREEAIQSAGEVAENYHNAVEGFQEAQMQNDGTAHDTEEAGEVSASGDSPDAGNDLDGGEGCDGGVDF